MKIIQNDLVWSIENIYGLFVDSKDAKFGF